MLTKPLGISEGFYRMQFDIGIIQEAREHAHRVRASRNASDDVIRKITTRYG